MGMIRETKRPASQALETKNPTPLLERLVISAVSLHGLEWLSLPLTTALSFDDCAA